VNQLARLFPAGFVALLTWSACGSGLDPAKLFAEGEGLRLQFEKQAAHQAIAKYEQAMKVWARRGNHHQAAVSGQRMAATYEQLGSLEESRRRYEGALQHAKQSRDLVLESEIGSDLGIVLARLATDGKAFDAARTACRAALYIAQHEAHNQRAAAKALNCLGEVAYHRRLPDDALGFYLEAARLWDRLGDRRGQAQTLVYQGDVHSELSRFDQAEKCYGRARMLWSLVGDKRELAITLVADARLRVRRGEYQLALNGLTEALEVFERMGDPIWTVSTLTGIGWVYQDMGEGRSALEYWERALELFETAGLKSVLADVLIALGETYLAVGDDAAALKRFERALAVADEQGTGPWKALALRSIGVVHLFRRQPARAREFFDRSLIVQTARAGSGDPRLKAKTLADLGEAAGLDGEQETALEHFDEALALSRAAMDRVAEARALSGLARASLALGDLTAARRHVERALLVAESLRTAVESRDLRASYSASVYDYNELYIDILMRLRAARSEERLTATAFEANERARARSLLESLTEAGVDLRTGVEQTLLERERALNQAFGQWAERQRGQSAEPGAQADVEVLTREYRTLEERFQQIQAEIRSRSPRYAAMVRPQPVKVGAVQSEVLDDHTVLLEYALGEERSYLFAVSKRHLTSHQLPPRGEIERTALRVSELLTARLTASGDQRERHRKIHQADSEYWTEAGRLSQILLAPVAGVIAGKRILVVADGALQYVPFAALPMPGPQPEPVPMVADHEIVNLPSASVLAVVRRETAGRPPPAGSVAVLADPVFEPDDPRLLTTPAPAGRFRTYPRLLATRQEAAAIIATAPEGTTLRALDFNASRATATSPGLARYRIVHFATHAVFDSENPAVSGIVLSMFDERGGQRDGFLRLHDIYQLTLPAELVVLSACNTALGRQLRGEGLVGVVRGFMYAGAKRVVASLWRVDDEATGELMARFYREMLQQNRSPAAALREAQLMMLQQERWRPPYYWAAFVLQGEWR
jgi:CHAT domain-containing protein